MEIVPDEDLKNIYNSFDIIGDIAVIRLNEYSKKYGQLIAQAIMKMHHNVKVVLGQISPVHGEFRLRKLEHLVGENRTTTIHKESGCLFAVDLNKCYFSPRLFYERLRIAKLVGCGETILNMFAGVGCFSIVIAKKSDVEKVYSVDVNPDAVWFMRENVRLNSVHGRVIPIESDAKEIAKRLRQKVDRVLMPLPEKALDYLPYAVEALKPGCGWIHYYDFEHAYKCEDPLEKVKHKVREKLESLGAAFNFRFARIVRSTGPNWYQVVLDISVSK
ncbi:MAG: class I SAM-dependent methyltransferase family protein [Candidatus Bathyarchaeota archaeon]|nr:class I SAM-dependent methyltransferase family protein [Candidatus Bathyarchaeota archaeon]MCX8177790.1 class I SAM-dependent methyltransferase family protein [Candidatus Bathyarchaeota archaeon]MDW8194039.1 class I SAM-dependent methyltransferase family protein [Nitrososphaerota archaeon]